LTTNTLKAGNSSKVCK